MALLKRRRYPRRQFKHKVGVLYRGHYLVGDAWEIGEGGIRFSTDHKLEAESVVVLSFLVSTEVYVITKGQLRYQSPPKEDGRITFGFQFLDIAFDKKRAIRDYIAAKTEAEAARELANAEEAA
ncbi:MAG: PilZ domain-containing protein [Bdellovibrionales bacterium]|nr:PilZ domain-containing protein [Bdellovibrionales bacterium]